MVVNSEYMPLKEVLLYRPGPEIESIDNPGDVLHIRKINYRIIDEEYQQILKLYSKLNIRSQLINIENQLEGGELLFNLMYTRDLFFMTPEGAILSSMAHKVRRDEVKYAERTIREIGIPVMMIVEGSGTFEGADALWVNDKLVVIGVGNRTNFEGFLQVRNGLKAQGIDCIYLPAPSETQHLLGALQFVDSDLVLVRVELVDSKIIDFLKENNINIVAILEDEEVMQRQAMNIVVVAAREIIMPADCPKTKKIYQNYGIKILAEVKISQLINGGGGLACATAHLSRDNNGRG